MYKSKDVRNVPDAYDERIGQKSNTDRFENIYSMKILKSRMNIRKRRIHVIVLRSSDFSKKLICYFSI